MGISDYNDGGHQNAQETRKGWKKWICDNCATRTNLACFGSVGTLSGFQVVYPEKATSIDVVQHYIS